HPCNQRRLRTPSAGVADEDEGGPVVGVGKRLRPGGGRARPLALSAALEPWQPRYLLRHLNAGQLTQPGLGLAQCLGLGQRRGKVQIAEAPELVGGGQLLQALRARVAAEQALGSGRQACQRLDLAARSRQGREGWLAVGTPKDRVPQGEEAVRRFACSRPGPW